MVDNTGENSRKQKKKGKEKRKGRVATEDRKTEEMRWRKRR